MDKETQLDLVALGIVGTDRITGNTLIVEQRQQHGDIHRRSTGRLCA